MRVLIISLSPKWKEPPRLARALTEAGACVASLAVHGSLLEYSGFLERRFTFVDSAQPNLSDLVDAIDTFAAEVLLPGDERSVRWLHQLYRDLDSSAPLKSLLTSSLGDSTWYGRTTDKFAMFELARELGIPQPQTSALTRDADAHEFVHRHGWPIVIKACQGYAGMEVFPCGNLRELRYALCECAPDAPRLIQRFLYGVTWMVSFVARQGQLLGALVAEKQRQHPLLIGPSTTLRFAREPVLIEPTRRLLQRLGYSGFGSIDYLRIPNHEPLFIEFNPRATPICHLGGKLGVNLVQAFLDGNACDNSAVRDGQRVALFPQELKRDPSGAGLADCWHDIPEDEPDLVAAMQSI